MARRMLPLLCLLLLVPTTWSSLAYGKNETDVEQAQRTILDLTQSGLQVLQSDSASGKNRETELTGLLDSSFDLPGMARFVIGRHWRSSSAEEQTEFTKLFERYTVFTFLTRIQKFKLDEIKVHTARKARNNEYHVSSIYPLNRGDSLELVWVLTKKQDGMKVTDLRIDGISIRVTQRSEFGSVIDQRGGLGELNKLLERKVTQLEKRQKKSR